MRQWLQRLALCLDDDCVPSLAQLPVKGIVLVANSLSVVHGWAAIVALNDSCRLQLCFTEHTIATTAAADMVLSVCTPLTDAFTLPNNVQVSQEQEVCVNNRAHRQSASSSSSCSNSSSTSAAAEESVAP
jgi:hypothetical protein